jgi:hypothetical protein
VTQLRWEVEGKELEARQQLAAAVAERDDAKAKLEQQRDDSVQVRRAVLPAQIMMRCIEFFL